MKHVYRVTADPYGWRVLIYVGSWAQVRGYVLREHGLDMGEQEFGGGSHQVIGPVGGVGLDWSLVWLPHFRPDSLEDWLSLSHELAHVAFHVLSACGVPVGPDGNEEALCYLHEDLLRKSVRALTEKVAR